MGIHLNPAAAQDTSTAPPPELTSAQTVAWLLDRFVLAVPGVTHALVASRDGLSLLTSSTVEKDWADTVSAALCGYASLAASTPGPDGRRQAARQIAIEFADHVVVAMAAGVGQRSAFSHDPDSRGSVETVLGVYADGSANLGMVGYEMRKLINRFPQHMETAVRQGMAESHPGGSAAGPR